MAGRPLALRQQSPLQTTSSSTSSRRQPCSSRQRSRWRALYKAGDGARDLPDAEAVEPTDEAPDLSPEVLTAENALDAEILRLLVPATLAVFLDPAMALVDTGAHMHPVKGEPLDAIWPSIPGIEQSLGLLTLGGMDACAACQPGQSNNSAAAACHAACQARLQVMPLRMPCGRHHSTISGRWLGVSLQQLGAMSKYALFVPGAQ